MRTRRSECPRAMKILIRFLSGIAASILLAAGLNAAAAKVDPLSKEIGANKPENSTTDHGVQSTPPCYGGGGGHEEN